MRSSNLVVTTNFIEVRKDFLFSGPYVGKIPGEFERFSWRLCSSNELLNHEIDFIKTTLLSNGYPLSFLSSCINNFLKKTSQIHQYCYPHIDLRKGNLSLPYLIVEKAA